MSVAIHPISHVSIPRSGHHMLVSILSETFEWGQFIHCESYDFPGCCHATPCIRVAARANEAFGGSKSLRLYLQKSHDMQDELSVLAPHRYLVQVRHPLQACIGWLRWHQTPIQLAELNHSALGFLTYYLRFFHKWVANSRLQNRFLLRYEDLVVGPEWQTRSALAWAGVTFDEARLQDAVAHQAGIDAHTGQSRAQGASIYRPDDYLRLFGPFHSRLLSRLAKFCPGLPYDVAVDATDDETIDEWIFGIDLRYRQEFRVDFSDARALIDTASVRGRLGIPHAFGFGFSPPETGHGCWTDGDVCILPFRIAAGVKRAQVELRYRQLRGGPEWEHFDVEFVLEGRFCAPTQDEHRLESQVYRRRTDFDMEQIPAPDVSEFLEGCVVLRFTGLLRGDPAYEKRKLGILLASFSLSTD